MSQKNKNSKKLNDQEKEVVASVLNGISIAYSVFVLAIYPLLFHHGYTDILDTKSRFFFVIGGGIVILGAFMMLIHLALSLKYQKDKKRMAIKNTNNKEFLSKIFSDHTVSVLVTVFLVATTLSFLLSKEKEASFYGTNGRKYGYLAIMIAIVGFYLIAYYFDWIKKLSMISVISACIVIVVSIFNLFQIDILSMYQGGWEDNHFTSTLGNNNSMAAYLTVIIPILMYAVMKANNIYNKTFLFILCTLSFASMLSCSSDSVYIAFFVVVIFLVWFSLEEISQTMWVSFLISSFFFIHFFLGRVRDFGVSMNTINGIPKQLMQTPLSIVFSLVFLCIGFLLYAFKKKEMDVSRLRTIYIFVVAILFIMIATVIIFVNTRYENKEAAKELGFFASYLYFDETWGTNRGTNFTYSIRLFDAFSPIHKLFGFGPGTFYYALLAYVGDKVMIAGQQMIDAHNAFFQYLITTGILGVISYYAVWVSAIVTFVRKKDVSKVLGAVSLVLIAYLIQGIVNNPHIYIEPMIFVILGIGVGEVLRHERKSANH